MGLMASAAGAGNDPVLLTVDGHDIPLSEFKYLYNKNNTQQVQPQTLDQYLGMFVDYKLKVADAGMLGIDTTSTFRNELATFRNELARPYMRDTEVEKRLIEEAYSRRREEVEVSHVMLRLDEGNEMRLDSIRKAIVSGKTTFEEAAKQYSADRHSAENGGRMGFIIPDRYPYAFEKVAYETPVGGISEVVNSGVGYHIIRVDSRRPTRGEVLVEHILRLTRGRSEQEIAEVRRCIDSLYNEAKNGADFKELARLHSQDPGTARNGGELPWFGSGAMVAEFDSVAFALADGEISEPFATRFGYHIIHKLDSRMLQPLDEVRGDIIRAMSKDERGNMPEMAVRDRLIATRHAKVLPKALKKIGKIIKDNGGYDSTAISRLYGENMVVATFDGGAPITLDQVMPSVPRTLSTDVDNAVSLIGGAAHGMLLNALEAQYRDNLASENAEYRNLLNEYRDGILLYEISNRNVWDRAARDSEGLNAYFRANASRYAWQQPKFKSFVLFASSDSVMQVALRYADSLSTDNPVAFVADMRRHFGNDVKVERVIAAKGENPITDYLAFDGDKAAAEASTSWKAFAAYKGRIIDAPEEAADVRGAAVTDYQAELDRRWVEELRRKYTVKVNNKVFEQLKRETQAHQE